MARMASRMLGNYNAASSPTTLVVNSDTTAPTVTITASDGTNAIASGRTDSAASLTFTFTLSEVAAAGSSFAFADITASSCSGSSISGTGPYTLVCAASTGNDVSVQVAANKFTDAAGNGNEASSVFVVTSDTTAPTVSITASDVYGRIATNGYSRASTITWTFDLSEPAAQIAHSGGVAANAGDTFVLADVSTQTNCDNPVFVGSSLQYTLRCDAKSGSAITVGVAQGSGTNGFKDAAGNYNAASSPTTLVVNSDTTAPTVTITASDGSGKTNGQASIATGTTAITFSFALSEAAAAGSSFTIGDISMANCLSMSTLSGSGQAFTLTCGANDGKDVSARVNAGVSQMLPVT